MTCEGQEECKIRAMIKEVGEQQMITMRKKAKSTK